MFKQLDLIILDVQDMKAATQFYHQILGFGVKGSSSEWTTFDMDKTTLAIRPVNPELADERHVKHGVIFGFSVRDVDQKVAELEKQGAHILVRPRSGTLGRYAEIADPDGHIIMLTTADK